MKELRPAADGVKDFQTLSFLRGEIQIFVKKGFPKLSFFFSYFEDLQFFFTFRRQNQVFTNVGRKYDRYITTSKKKLDFYP